MFSDNVSRLPSFLSSFFFFFLILVFELILRPLLPEKEGWGGGRERERKRSAVTEGEGGFEEKGG